MYIGTIRPVETASIDLAGSSLEEIRRQAAAATPDGFHLVSVPVKMTAGSSELTATATFERRDGLRDIEADDRDALLARVPDGWKLVSMRKL